MITLEYILIKSILFVIVYTFFHFAYDYIRWSIFAVSESVWEHLKIAYYSALSLALVEVVALSLIDNTILLQSFLLSRLTGLLTIVPLIFLFFYFVYGVFGILKNKVVKIVSVVMLTWFGGFCAYFIEAYILYYPINKSIHLLGLLFLLASMLLFLFIKFTYKIPTYPVFEETIMSRKK